MVVFNNANFTPVKGGEINASGQVQNGGYFFDSPTVYAADFTETLPYASAALATSNLEVTTDGINDTYVTSPLANRVVLPASPGEFDVELNLSADTWPSGCRAGLLFYIDDNNHAYIDAPRYNNGDYVMSLSIKISGTYYFSTVTKNATTYASSIRVRLIRDSLNRIFGKYWTVDEADWADITVATNTLSGTGNIGTLTGSADTAFTAKYDALEFNSGNPVDAEFKINDSGDTKIDLITEVNKGTVTAVTTGTLTVKEDVNETGTFGSYGTDSAWSTPGSESNYPHTSETGRYWWPYLTLSGDASTFTSLTAESAKCSAPNVTGTTPTNDSTPTWNWNSTATSPAGTGNFRYQLDGTGGAWTETTGTTFTPASALSHGAHTLYVQEETDPSGSGVWSDSGSFAITVDLVAPAAPSVSGPASPTNDDTPTWTWSAGGGGNGTFRYQLNSEAGSWDETTELSYTPASGLSDAEHTLYVQERDAAGNWSTSGSYAVTVDTAAPSAPVVTGETPTTDRTPTWTWETGGGGNGNYRHQLNSEAGSWTETTETTFTPASDLDVDTHTLYVQERDAAGNWSASGSHAITVNAGAPAAPTGLTLTPASPTNNATPTLSWTQGTGGDQAGTGNYQVRVDAGTPEDVIGTTSWTPATDLAHGTHTLEVREEGIYGDYSTWSSLEITIDTVAPAAPTVDATTPTTDNTPTFTITPGGGGNGTFRWRRNGSAWIETTETIITPVTSWSDGDNVIDAQERDAVGNWSVSGSLIIVVDTTPPLSPVVSVDSPTNDNTPEFNWTPGGGGNGTYRVQMDSEAGAWETVEATSYTPGTALADGSHTLYVQERDDAGNWSASGSATVEVDTAAPTAPTVTGPDTPTTDTTPTWTWETGGGGIGSYRYRINGDDWVLSSSESHTPASPLASGVYIFEVQERDAVGNWSASGSYTVTVDTTAPGAPVVTGPASPSYDRTPTWSWTSGGGGNGNYRYDLNDSGYWNETTETSYTPAENLEDGTYTMAVQERDEVGNWSESGSFSITVATATLEKARQIKIADAVKDELASLSFGIPVTVTRSYLAFYDLENAPENPELLIAPGPVNVDSAQGGLEGDVWDWGINVALIRKADSDTEADECIKVAEDIYLALRNQVLGAARCVTKQFPLTYDEEALRSRRQFRAVLRFVFRRAE